MSDEIAVKVPDIGSSSKVDVIEILVKVGDEIAADTSLITLESDKASMEIPSPIAGKVTKIQTKVGDKIAQGDIILYVVTTEETKSAPKAPETQAQPQEPEKQVPEKAVEPATPPVKPVDLPEEKPSAASATLFAGPAVRRLAREFGVDLSQVTGSGLKHRITKDDLQSYVKAKLSQQSTGGQFQLPIAAAIDFSQFGDIEKQPLNKIKKLTGLNVHRSWITIPHVTQFDEADITELETFRQSESEQTMASGYKLTLLAFVCRVVAKALAVYPQFNASLDATGENLIYKKYYNIGIAVDTPNGLVVPVIKGVNTLSVTEIAKEMARLSNKARDKGLMPTDMSGGCFTLSSLGGIGGTAFTPIVNSPEVAILGLSRAALKPVYLQNEWQPRLMLPLSLSYDHRVVDGAEAARFSRFICDALSDIRRVLL